MTRKTAVAGASFGGGKADPGERAGPAAGAAGRVSDRGAALAGYGAGLLRAGPVRPGKPAKGRAGAGSSAAAVPLSDPQGRRDERRGRAAAVAAGGISAAVHKKARRSFRDLRAFVLAQREGFEPSCSCLQTDFESCAGKALAEKGRSKLVSLSPDFRWRQAVFERSKPEKWLWYESNRHPTFWPRLARFFGKMQDFMQDN